MKPDHPKRKLAGIPKGVKVGPQAIRRRIKEAIRHLFPSYYYKLYPLKLNLYRRLILKANEIRFKREKAALSKS